MQEYLLKFVVSIHLFGIEPGALLCVPAFVIKSLSEYEKLGEQQYGPFAATALTLSYLMIPPLLLHSAVFVGLYGNPVESTKLPPDVVTLSVYLYFYFVFCDFNCPVIEQ